MYQNLFISLVSKEMFTILLAVEKMDFLVYTFVYNTQQDYTKM